MHFAAGHPRGSSTARAAARPQPRFESQPVQGVSSIKPGPTAGAWWALSDNGFGGKWNSPDYRLCIYLFDVRPRTQHGHGLAQRAAGRDRAFRSREVLSVATRG